MTQAERTQQWRAIFKEAQAKQLEELPLSALDSPLERAKYQVALRFFRKQEHPHFGPQRLALWRADDATRRAFFDCFGFERDDVFYLQDGSDVPSGPRNYGPIYLYSRCSHLFSALENGQLTRTWNWRAATRAGLGQSDQWRFDGNELVFVRTLGGWIS